ncbi:MAG: sigma-54-dependent Fis family transcriptional regulator [Bacteroidales bacterium]|nr:sigma-54-dependent Fis family transcriptional regulator [Bacteroidales bacterium]MBR6226913.1 sigma-54-dependent Fis family transcriptional regulator [Bacteroidales bacterium]
MSKLKSKILVVDDNAGIRSALKILLPMRFAEVELIASPKVLMETMRTFKPDVVLLDMNFETDINTGNEGLFWLSELKRDFPEVEVVLFTAYADIALAVEGMKRGAFDFVVKPWDNAKLLATLEEACKKHRVGTHRMCPPYTNAAPTMRWGESEAMQQLRTMVEKVAPTDATVLITGENGTGKDVLANEIHRLSNRANKPMVGVDIGAITDTLFESEMFGHVKGAFTDAHADHIGKFEQANGTTLFLDEIGNVPLAQQAKLLRVIQNRSITKVGDTKSIPIDIRLICATNMDLATMVKEGRFREDLFYRINTVTLHLPPLRERPDEIITLAEMFIKQYAEKYHRKAQGLSDEAMNLLKRCRWSGNIRELQGCIEKAVIYSEAELIRAADLQLRASELMDETAPKPQNQTLESAEEQVIRNAMKTYNGNLTLVAKALKISRPTLYRRLKEYGI